jgi:hypothetical protein
MIERALLFQDSLKELYVKECPTSGGTIHPEHVRDLQILLSQSLYHEKILAVKGVAQEWRTLMTSNFVRASSVRLRLRLHQTTTPGQATMMMAWGAAATVNPATPPPRVLGSNHWAEPDRMFEQQAALH